MSNGCYVNGDEEEIHEVYEGGNEVGEDEGDGDGDEEGGNEEGGNQNESYYQWW